MYKINILKKAQLDLDWFRRNDKNSRRINHKDRLIYTIYEEFEEIDITSFRGHYE